MRRASGHLTSSRPQPRRNLPSSTAGCRAVPRWSAPPHSEGGGGSMRATDAVGRYGEKLAGRYLEANGLIVLDRRWRCPQGEVDLIAVDGDCLVICEVKTRRS